MSEEKTPMAKFEDFIDWLVNSKAGAEVDKRASELLGLDDIQPLSTDLRCSEQCLPDGAVINMHRRPRDDNRGPPYKMICGHPRLPKAFEWWTDDPAHGTMIVGFMAARALGSIPEGFFK